MPENEMSETQRIILEDIRNTVNQMRIDSAVLQNDIKYIKDQTTKTNGRVTKAEVKIADLEQYRTRMISYIAGASAVTGMIVTSALYILERFILG